MSIEDVQRKWRAAVGVIVAMLAVAGGAQAQTLDPGLQELIRRFPVETVDGRRIVRVSLQEVLEIGLARSLTISAARLGENAAQQSLIAAQGRNVASLATSLQQGRSISQSSSSLTSTNYRDLVGTDAQTLTSTLSKRTDLGITYGLTYQEVRARNELMKIVDEGDTSVSTVKTDARDTSAFSIGANIPLGKDGGYEYNQIPVRQGEVGVRRSLSVTRKTELDLLSQIAQTYWLLVGALETVRVRQEAVKLSTQLLADNRVRLQAGVLSPADVQVTETQLQRDRQNLLDARLQVLAIEDQVRAALALEGLDIGLLPKDTPTLREEKFDLLQQLERLYKNSPDLQLTQADLALSSLALQAERNNERTKLDVDLAYIFNGYSNNPFGGIQYYGDQRVSGYSAKLTYTLPLFDSATPANIQRRLLERQQIELRFGDQRSALSVQLQTALRNLSLAAETVATARESVRLAEVQLNNEIERFRLGRSTAFQVSQFQQQLYEARLAEIQARVGFERNDVQRVVLTGDLYTRYKLPTPDERSSSK